MKILTVFVLLLIILSSFPVSFASLNDESFKHINLVAVHEEDGKTEGVLTDLQVLVTDGSGHVFVDTEPFTQVDMQGSARLAAMVACDLLGLDMQSYDFYYVIKVDSPVVGGPSGGAAMTVATVASLLGLPIRNDVVMTGMINPDGTIGPVGGIPEKLNASADAGATLFLIPEGQRVTQVVERVEKKSGPLIIVSEKTHEVDLVALGKERGIDVREVGDVRQAIKIFTGYSIPEHTHTGKVQTEYYQQIMRTLAEKLLGEVDERYKDVSKVCNSSSEQELVAQLDKTELARELYDESHYYASTSQCFSILINLRSIEYLCEYNDATDKDAYLLTLQNQVSQQISISREKLSSLHNGTGLIDIEGLGAAESRVQEAESLLTKAQTSHSAKEQIDLLAYSYERARSAQWWAWLAQTSGVENFQEDELYELAGNYISQAQSIQAYATTLVSESGATGLMSLVDTSDAYIGYAKNEFSESYYAGAIYDALHSMTYSSLAIELIGVQTLDEKIKRYNASAQSAILTTRSAGIEPILAVSAYEHGAVMDEGDVEKLIDYGFARLSAKTTLNVLSHFGYTSYSLSSNMSQLLSGLTSDVSENQTQPQPTNIESNQVESGIPASAGVPSLGYSGVSLVGVLSLLFVLAGRKMRGKR